MAHFALNQAAYCPSCDTVGDDLTRCACCRATSLLVLATVLNRAKELLTLDLYSRCHARRPIRGSRHRQSVVAGGPACDVLVPPSAIWPARTSAIAH